MTQFQISREFDLSLSLSVSIFETVSTDIILWIIANNLIRNISLVKMMQTYTCCYMLTINDPELVSWFILEFGGNYERNDR